MTRFNREIGGQTRALRVNTGDSLWSLTLTPDLDYWFVSNWSISPGEENVGDPEAQVFFLFVSPYSQLPAANSLI